jgi:ribonuclease BN (tRNA processing enzyme)
MTKAEKAMTLTVIGCYGKYPAGGYATGCYLLQGGGKNIVIDMGSGALLKLSKYIDPFNIDAIILTHLHGDHIADIFTYKNIALERKAGQAKVRLFAPPSPGIVSDAILDGNFFDYSPLESGGFNIGDIECHAYKMTHPLETYGIKFSLGGSVFSYTSDTLDNPNLPPLIDGAGLILADACVLEQEFNENSKHIAVGKISRLTQGKPLILTHLFYGKEEKILAEARQYNSLAVLAREGLSIRI